MKLENSRVYIYKKGEGVFGGERYYESPVDIPPIIEANGRKLYEEVWEREGWTVTPDDD